MTTSTDTPPPTELDKYFARYQEFDYDPAAPAAIEFQRLSKEKNWRCPDGSWTKKGGGHRRRFHEAFDREFTEKFGYLANDGAEGRKQKWMYLAEVVELDPIPETISQLRKAMSGIKVNIFDVLQAERAGEAVLKFPNVKALALYSYASGKIFPKKKAKGGALKFLLKGISEKCGTLNGVSLADMFGMISI